MAPHPAAPVRTPLIVAESLALFRDALAGLLAAWPHGPVLTAADAVELYALLRSGPPSVVLLDVSLAPPARLRAAYPAHRLVALLPPGETLAEGADAVASRAAGAAELVCALTSVCQESGARPPGTLTGRQRDVLRLLAEGRSTKDIARTLDLAVSTIKVHLAAAYRTVGARNRVEALCRAGVLAALPPGALSRTGAVV